MWSLLLIQSFDGTNSSWAQKTGLHAGTNQPNMTYPEVSPDDHRSLHWHSLVIMKFGLKKKTQEDGFCNMFDELKVVILSTPPACFETWVWAAQLAGKVSFSDGWLHFCPCILQSGFKRKGHLCAVNSSFCNNSKIYSSLSQSSSKTPACWDPGAAYRVLKLLRLTAWISANTFEKRGEL